MPKVSLSDDTFQEVIYTHACFGEFSQAWDKRMRIIASNLGLFGPDEDDAVQFVLEKLYRYRYLDRWDPAKAKFATFAHFIIMGWMRRFRQEFMNLRPLTRAEREAVAPGMDGKKAWNKLRRPVVVESLEAKLDDPDFGDFQARWLGVYSSDDLDGVEDADVQRYIKETLRQTYVGLRNAPRDGCEEMARTLKDVIEDYTENGDVSATRIASRRKAEALAAGEEDYHFTRQRAQQRICELLATPEMDGLKQVLQHIAA